MLSFSFDERCLLLKRPQESKWYQFFSSVISFITHWESAQSYVYGDCYSGGDDIEGINVFLFGQSQREANSKTTEKIKILENILSFVIYDMPSPHSRAHFYRSWEISLRLILCAKRSANCGWKESSILINTLASALPKVDPSLRSQMLLQDLLFSFFSPLRT